VCQSLFLFSPWCTGCPVLSSCFSKALVLSVLLYGLNIIHLSFFILKKIYELPNPCYIPCRQNYMPNNCKSVLCNLSYTLTKPTINTTCVKRLWTYHFFLCNDIMREIVALAFVEHVFNNVIHQCRNRYQGILPCLFHNADYLVCNLWWSQFIQNLDRRNDVRKLREIFMY